MVSKYWTLLITVSLCHFISAVPSATDKEYLTPGFRPPSVPLVVINPYIRSVRYLLPIHLVGVN